MGKFLLTAAGSHFLHHQVNLRIAAIPFIRQIGVDGIDRGNHVYFFPGLTLYENECAIFPHEGVVLCRNIQRGLGIVYELRCLLLVHAYRKIHHISAGIQGLFLLEALNQVAGSRRPGCLGHAGIRVRSHAHVVRRDRNRPCRTHKRELSILQTVNISIHGRRRLCLRHAANRDTADIDTVRNGGVCIPGST